MTTIALRLLAVFSLALSALHAAEDPLVAKLRTTDDARVVAIIAGDRARLTTIFADDLRYAHSNGVVDDKASYIETLVSGRTKYLLIDYTERNFTFPAPGVALMSGRARVQVAKADGKLDMVLGFLAAWREEKGQWRFLAWQSCKLPDAPVAK